MTAAGVDALLDGLCILGIGASGPQVIEGFHGIPFGSPVGRAEKIIEICRTIWRREPLAGLVPMGCSRRAGRAGCGR